MRKANVFINTNKKTQQQQHQQRNDAAQHQPQKKRIRNVRHNKNIFNLLKLCSALHFVLESNTGAQTRRTISLHLHSHTYTHAHAYIESRVADKKIR